MQPAGQVQHAGQRREAGQQGEPGRALAKALFVAYALVLVCVALAAGGAPRF